jgi:hypothetical protein
MYSVFLTSLIISSLIIFFATKNLDIQSILLILLLSLLLTFILGTVGNTASLEAPFSINPLPPRYNHYGVSLDILGSDMKAMD